MAQGQESKCTSWTIGVITIVFFIGIFAPLAWYAERPADTTYEVTITSVGGLDPALDLHADRQALSPVFGITLHIDSTHNKLFNRRIGGAGSSVVVSYGDALLAKGAVPELCVKTSGVGEVAADAWGLNVQVPQFLRDRLAGELESGQAVVDVAVRTPAGCYINGCFDAVLVCKAKIQGGSSPCFSM
ncbi:hypothetical protein ACQJBY_010737 [Aegilops geniculata]